MRCPYERLAATRALLKVHPDHGRLFFLFKCRHHLSYAALRKTGCRCGCRAKLQKLSAVVTLLLHRLPDRLTHAHPPRSAFLRCAGTGDPQRLATTVQITFPNPGE